MILRSLWMGGVWTWLLIAVVFFQRRRIALLEIRLTRHQEMLTRIARQLEALERGIGSTASAAQEETAAESVPGGISIPVSSPPIATPPPIVYPRTIVYPDATPQAPRLAPQAPWQTLGPHLPTPPPVVPVQQSIAAVEASSVPSEPTQDFVPPPPIPPSASPTGGAFDWENLIGVRMFSWVAGIALALAAVFFLRYSVDRGWLSPPVRMTIGLLTGAGLLVACELRAARRYAVTANALDAAGILILFATFFASHALWNLIPQIPTFGLLALVTATAVLLSIRRDSIFIAVLGLLGGFSTPILLSTGEDHPIGLFGYLLLLNVGLAWVAYRKQWPILTILTLAFTTVYQWGWIARYFDPSRVPLAIGIFLLFPAVGAAAYVLGRRQAESAEARESFFRTVSASALLPVLFAAYLAVVPTYGEHYTLLFGFLLIVIAGLVCIALASHALLLHLAAAASTFLVFAIWFGVSWTGSAWPGILGWLSSFVLVFLAAPAGARYFRLPFDDVNRDATVVAGLLPAFCCLVLALEPATAEPGLLFGVLFALIVAIGAAAIRFDLGPVYHVAAFAAVAAQAVWSAMYLAPERVLSALILYGGFAGLNLALPLVADYFSLPLRAPGAGAALAGLGLLFFLAVGPVAAHSLWAIAVLLPALNIGLLLHAVRYGLAPWALAATMLSWLVLATWCATSLTSAVLLPALFLVSGFALLNVIGNLWADDKSGTGDDRNSATLFGQGTFFALGAHAFLWWIVTQPALAIPPWPWLAVLAVVDLAIGAAALHARRGKLHAAAVGASHLILLQWVVVAGDAPWTSVALVADSSLVAMAIAWIFLAERRREGSPIYSATAIGSAFVAQLIAVVAATMPGAPDWYAFFAIHAALAVTLLILSWRSGWHPVAVVAALSSAASVWLWQNGHLSSGTWQREMLFAFTIYAIYLAWPLVLGKRLKTLREPHMAAILASAAFFFLARRCMIAGGLDNVIGILPVGQAGLLSLLLAQLLRLEPPGERDTGRLAMVAGVTLAFVTVAIPLQLDRQWITIGWALEAVALAWLYGHVPHRGLLLWTGALCAAAFVRLCLNPAVLEYHPRTGTPIINWYLYTYTVVAASLFACAQFLRRVEDRLFEGMPPPSHVLAGSGAILLFLLLNIEIADFYSTGSTLTFDFDAGLAQDLTYTLGWGVFAIALLTVGIVRVSRGVRIASLALLVVTVVKCFLHDLWRLGGLYRVGSFVGLALCLTLVALVLQKFVLSPQQEKTA